MTNTYPDDAPVEKKLKEEAVCLSMTFSRIAKAADTPYIECKITPELVEELRKHRCLWERILRELNEALFVDYQQEKFSGR